MEYGERARRRAARDDGCAAGSGAFCAGAKTANGVPRALGFLRAPGRLGGFEGKNARPAMVQSRIDD